MLARHATVTKRWSLPTRRQGEAPDPRIFEGLPVELHRGVGETEHDEVPGLLASDLEHEVL